MWNFDYQIDRKLSDVWDIETLRGLPNYRDAREVEQIDGSISEAEFDENYRRPLRPVVIRGAVDHWPACEKWSDPFYLSEHSGDRDIRITKGLLLDWQLKRISEYQVFPFQIEDTPSDTITLDRYLSLITSDFDLEDIVYAAHIPLESIRPLESDLGELPFIDDDMRLSTSFFVGKSTFTDLHYHQRGQDAITCQLTGRKEFILYPPDQRHWDALYPPPFGNWSRVRLFDLELDKFPKFAQTTPYKVILNPGDALYIPNPWWHAVWSNDEFSSICTHWFSPRRFRLRDAPSRRELWRNPSYVRRLYDSDQTECSGWPELLGTAFGSSFP